MKNTRSIKDLFKRKTRWHKEQAKLSWPKKIETLVKLQKIANDIRPFPKNSAKMVWKIEEGK